MHALMQWEFEYHRKQHAWTCTEITETDLVKMGKMWCSQPSVVSSSDVVLSSIYAHIGNNLCIQSRNTGWKYKVHKKVLLI